MAADSCPNCPPGSDYTAWQAQSALGSSCNSCGTASSRRTDISTYWVSEPALNLRIETPLGKYSPALGPAVSFNLSYRQRADVLEDAVCFGVGTNWSCSFRAYVMNLTGTTAGLVRMHRGDAGFVDYFDGLPQFREGSIMHILNSGQTYELDWPNGARQIFQSAFTNGSGIVHYYLTQQISPDGNAITYSYSTSAGIFKLASIIDGDGATNSLYYENGSFPNRITRFVDRYLRTNTLAYDSTGYLTNASDASSGLSTAFQYDSGTRQGWITNMVTSYGTTQFRYGGVDADLDLVVSTNNLVNRFVEVTLPNGGKDLYLFRLDCSGFMPQTYASVPSMYGLSNTLDNVDQYSRTVFIGAHFSTQDCPVVINHPETFPILLRQITLWAGCVTG